MFPIKNLGKIPAHEPATELATELEVPTEPTKATKAKSKNKISSLKLREKFLNGIKNDNK